LLHLRSIFGALNLECPRPAASSLNQASDPRARSGAIGNAGAIQTPFARRRGARASSRGRARGRPQNRARRLWRAVARTPRVAGSVRARPRTIRTFFAP